MHYIVVVALIQLGQYDATLRGVRRAEFDFFLEETAVGFLRVAG
jgi:hypothetical protein